MSDDCEYCGVDPLGSLVATGWFKSFLGGSPNLAIRRDSVSQVRCFYALAAATVAELGEI